MSDRTELIADLRVAAEGNFAIIGESGSLALVAHRRLLNDAAEELERLAGPQVAGTKYLDIVIDGPPGNEHSGGRSLESGRFFKIEDDQGKTVDVGEWRNYLGVMWALRLQVADQDAITPSEALFAFMGWLTCRKEVSGPFSSIHDAAAAVELVAEFCESQGFAEPRDGYTLRLKAYPGRPGVDRNPHFRATVDRPGLALESTPENPTTKGPHAEVVIIDDPVAPATETERADRLELIAHHAFAWLVERGIATMKDGPFVDQADGVANFRAALRKLDTDRLSSSERRSCDRPGCGKPAEYYIHPVGPVSFEDFFHVCPDHLGYYMRWTTVNGQPVEHYLIQLPHPPLPVSPEQQLDDSPGRIPLSEECRRAAARDETSQTTAVRLVLMADMLEDAEHRARELIDLAVK